MTNGEASTPERLTPRQLADGLRDRLRYLLRTFSQSEISRRTGVPQSSISRYLDGQRIPAELCSRIVMELGVSPRWILAGEGPVYASELSEAGRERLKDLRQLLEAINTLSESGLGSLGEKPHERDLTELHHLLRQHHDLRERLSRETRPLFEMLLGEARRTLESDSDHHTAQFLLDLCEELNRISDEPQLSADLRGFQAFVLNRDKRSEEALALRRQVFRDTFYQPESDPEEQIAREFNFVSTLRNAGYVDESARLGRALMELHSHHRDREPYWLLPCHVALTEIDSGSLRSGIKRLLDCLPRTSQRFRDVQQAHIAYGLVLQGAQSLAATIRTEVDRVRNMGIAERAMVGLMLLRIAVTLESVDDMTALHAEFLPVIRERYPLLDPLPDYSVILQRALAGESVDLDGYESKTSAIDDELFRAENAVYLTQLSRVMESEKALEWFQEAERRIEELPDGRSAKLTVRWLHAKNGCALVGPSSGSRRARDAQHRARAFLDDSVNQGYQIFAR